MQPGNRLFDDLSQLMTNAMGVAQGARAEAETVMKSWIDRWLADRDFVTREEFDAVRAMAQKAREENEALAARIAALEAAAGKGGSGKGGSGNGSSGSGGAGTGGSGTGGAGTGG